MSYLQRGTRSQRPLPSLFVGIKNGIAAVVRDSKRAHLQDYKDMRVAQKSLGIPNCHLLYIWKSPVIGDLVWFIRKGRVWTPLLKKAMVRMGENGFFTRLNKNHFRRVTQEPNCKARVDAIGMDKVGSLFIFLLIANLVSLCTYLVENITKTSNLKSFNNF